MSYNVKVLEYKDSTHIEIFTRPILEDSENKQNKVTTVIECDPISKIRIIEDLQEDIRNKHSLKVSMNRSKNNLMNIARSNKWDYFITITFDRTKVEASDYREVTKKIRTWLNNMHCRGSKELKYVIVPEFHKDGIHYHFHGLISNCNGLDLVDSGHVDCFGEIIYNIANWKYGFTTAVKVRDNGKVTNYIGKYISKEMMNKLKNKRRYFASMNCEITPEQHYNLSEKEILERFGVDYDYLKTRTIPEAGQRIKYIEINKKNIDS